jgi:hypothetical protein
MFTYIILVAVVVLGFIIGTTMAPIWNNYKMPEKIIRLEDCESIEYTLLTTQEPVYLSKNEKVFGTFHPSTTLVLNTDVILE